MMSSGTLQEVSQAEDWDALPNVRDLPLPGQDIQLGLDESMENLQQRVDMLEGAVIVGKNLVEHRRKAIWDHAQINNAKLEEIPKERKRIGELAQAVTIGVGIFAAWEFVRTSFFIVGFIRRRRQEAQERKAALEKLAEEEEARLARLGNRGRLHARQWQPK
jgi:hypothetical protein